ncbi:MAG: uncharacterized protein K0S00_4075 [Xanthobacteraceae bacterium]|jgi:hypothetical protein|nr:uncharacterized protein [Xanthobacteraceae bacterium]
MGAKVSIDIEDLLIWAYRQELPKVPAGAIAPSALKPGWSSMSAYGELLAVIDEADIRNRYGVTPDRMANGVPHVDALAVADAVAGLDGLLVEAPEGWWPFADMAAPDAWGEAGQAAVADALARLCVVGEDGARRFKTSPAWLVRKHAMVASVPEWEAEAPEYRTVRGGNGKAKWFMKRLVPQTVNGEIVTYAEHEVDGWCGSRRRPYKGAYHKMELVPSPFYAAMDRAEYEVWHAALAMLAEMLRESLFDHVATGPRRPARPWESAGPQTRILPSLKGLPSKGA